MYTDCFSQTHFVNLVRRAAVINRSNAVHRTVVHWLLLWNETVCCSVSCWYTVWEGSLVYKKEALSISQGKLPDLRHSAYPPNLPKLWLKCRRQHQLSCLFRQLSSLFLCFSGYTCLLAFRKVQIKVVYATKDENHPSLRQSTTQYGTTDRSFKYTSQSILGL